jgi:hypothetical protein
MRHKLSKLAIVIVSGPILSAAGIAPAHASGCISYYNYTDVAESSSSPFNASIGCDGVWAQWGYTYSDSVRGQYYKDGAWLNSTLGWQQIPQGTANNSKIIGNTVDGRRCRGVAFAHNQLVAYKY